MIHLISQSNSHDLFEKIYDNSKFSRIECKKVRFANNEIAVNISESVRNKTIAIIAQPVDYEDNFELLMTIDAARRASAKEIIAVIPLLPHSRQERRPEGQRTSISANLYASMLETAGLDRIITVDLHTTAIEGFYHIPVDNITPFNTFTEIINDYIINLDSPILVSPDFGGMKRVKKYANKLGLPMAFLNKERLRPNEIAETTLIGSVENQDVIIIDDLIDTGGTMIKSLELLYESGANSVRIMATHGLFSNNGDIKMINDNRINEIVVTNTLDQKHDDMVNVINIAPNIVNALNKLI